MPKTVQQQPLWQGPESDGDQGGVTQSILGRHLVCRERSRLKLIEGWSEADSFRVALEYGSMWHEADDALAANKDWRVALINYATKLSKRYPLVGDQINKWYQVCSLQFPIYVKYWEENQDVVDRIPIYQEKVFRHPYRLPSGRTVYLRGKYDAVDLIGGKRPGVYLGENKAKGTIDGTTIERELSFNLQTLLYLVVLSEDPLLIQRVRGVRYNVIRRPLSSGKHTIRPKKATKRIPAESMEDYYHRLGGLIEGEPDHYFHRWKQEVSTAELTNFKTQFLDPCLEELCKWYDWVTTGDPWRMGNKIHWRSPYGIYNLMDGKPSELDEYLLSGSTLGLEKTDNLFPELEK